MNLQILLLYIPIDPQIDCPTEKLLTCSCMQYLTFRIVWCAIVWFGERILYQ